MPKSVCNVRNCFLCRNCQKDWRDLIAVRKRNLFIKKGKVLFTEGETAKGIYLVYTGAFKVHMNWSKKKELILRFLKPGDLAGYRGFANQNIFPVTVTALEDSVVCFVDNDFWKSSLQTNSSLTFQLVQLYASELQRAEKRMHDLAHMDVKGRIASALLELLETYGELNDKTLAIVLTRQEIAEVAGTIYETVFKFFRQLTKAKIIATNGKKIKILNKEKLRSFI